MAQCECGCGQQAKKDFLPGHDQKLRTSLEFRLGGLLSLRAFVEAAESYANGETGDHAFLQRVRSLLDGLNHRDPGRP